MLPLESGFHRILSFIGDIFTRAGCDLAAEAVAFHRTFPFTILQPMIPPKRFGIFPPDQLLQPTPRPGGPVSLAGGFSLRPLPPSLFPSKYPPPFTQFQVFSTQVLAFVLPMCWVWHSHHASTSPSSTLLLTRVRPPSISPLLASGPTLSRTISIVYRFFKEKSERT